VEELVAESAEIGLASAEPKIISMGMFDYYRPKPDIACPVCGAAGLEWQGKQADCCLFLWEQGHAGPVDQFVDDDCKGLPEVVAKCRLPSRFQIYAECLCPTFLEAVGTTEQGVWTRTELASPTNAVASPDESEREFRNRAAGYAKHPGHAQSRNRGPRSSGK
jgi:hypothetical protein